MYIEPRNSTRVDGKEARMAKPDGLHFSIHLEAWRCSCVRVIGYVSEAGNK